MANIDWKGEQVARDLDAAILSGAIGGAHLIRDAAIEKTPLETGVLRGSAKVTDNGKDEAAVSYSTKYAAKQHEELGYAHPGGGQAKFLEKAGIENSQKVANLIADEIRKSLGL